MVVIVTGGGGRPADLLSRPWPGSKSGPRDTRVRQYRRAEAGSRCRKQKRRRRQKGAITRRREGKKQRGQATTTAKGVSHARATAGPLLNRRQGHRRSNRPTCSRGTHVFVLCSHV